MTDQILISRFYPVMVAGFPADTAAAEATIDLEAELLHRICLADGLLEVLEWTQQGTGADPLACMWLAGLRWHRLVTGGFPDGAPEPPARPTDAHLARLLKSGQLRITEGTGEVSLTGLASGELHYPSAPAQPDSTDQQVLLRLAPLALVPYIDEKMRMRWVEQNLAMTHGSPELLDQARTMITALHAEASAPASGQERHDDDGLGIDRAAAGVHPLFTAVEQLAQRWEQVSAVR